MIDKTGYIESLEAEGKEEAETRIENIDELRSKVAVYEESRLDQDEKPTLSGFWRKSHWWQTLIVWMRNRIM